MPLREELETTGNWLFRWRSYLPLLLIVPPLLDMQHYHWPLHSHRAQIAWEIVCMAVSFVGLGIRVATVGFAPEGTSGRNTKRQIAETLNTSGMYSIVRHPLYLGNFVMWLGVALFCFHWWLLAVFALSYWLYYERIMFAEEEFLRKKFGTMFTAWAEKTPAFFPAFAKWRPPSLSFSPRTALRREYSGFMGIVVTFCCVEMVEHRLVEGRLAIEPFSLTLGVLAVILYIAVRMVKKRSVLLSVEGR